MKEKTHLLAEEGGAWRVSKGLWSQFYISPGQRSLETPLLGSTTSYSLAPGAPAASRIENERLSDESAQAAAQRFSLWSGVAGEGMAVSWEGGTAAGWH